MDINNFGPYDAAVWGNVSSYLTLAVTSISLYLIWRTLRAQFNAGKDTKTMADIERERHKMEIRPFFITSMNGSPQYIPNEEAPKSLRLSLLFKNGSNYKAKNVSMEISNQGWSKQHGTGELVNEVLPGRTTSVQLEGPLNISDTKGHFKAFLEIQVIINFTDASNNPCQHTASIHLNFGTFTIFDRETQNID